VSAETTASRQERLARILRINGELAHRRVTIVHVTRDIDQAVNIPDLVLVFASRTTSWA
jgi:ABC-type proline/glycine betaine transport system ATPase subunit